MEDNKKIHAFTSFPISEIPKMQPIIIEKLSDKEKKLYEYNMEVVAPGEDPDWGNIKRFIVLDLDWYLVRFI